MSLTKALTGLSTAVSTEALRDRGAADMKLRAAIASAQAMPEVRRAVDLQRFARQGLDLLDGSGSCPLCDQHWQPEELKGRVERLLRSSEVAQHLRDRVEEAAKAVRDDTATVVNWVRAAAVASDRSSMPGEQAAFGGWSERLDTLLTLLQDALATYPDLRFTEESVARLIAPLDIADQLSRLSDAVAVKDPMASPEQQAWAALITLGERLKIVEDRRTQLAQANACVAAAATVVQLFDAAMEEALRDSTLARFVGFRCGPPQ